MQIYIRFFAVFNVLNGIIMLIWPGSWYEMTPGVSSTGPLNHHFVRDIGFAFVASGIGLWFGVTNSALRPWSGPIVAMVFLGGHAVFHLVEMFAHHLNARAVTRDMTYMHELAENAPSAFFGLLLITPLAQYRKAAPIEVYFAAKLVSTRRADCGPCLNLDVNMAREAGVAEAMLISILSEDGQVSDHVRLGMDFATAVIDQWGRAALTDLSLAVSFGAFFPTLKPGLGHAEGCQPVLRSVTTAQSQAT